MTCVCEQQQIHFNEINNKLTCVHICIVYKLVCNYTGTVENLC